VALPELARAGGRHSAPLIPTRAWAAAERDRLAERGGQLIFLGTPAYPPLLALLDDAPAVLGVLGDPEALLGRGVAVVGGRNASANGQRFAETLSAALAGAGLCVVSGLARGVDAAAHRGALGTGRTIAAIAGGLDKPYPPEHAGLQRQIAERGAVVAEAPLGVAPQARHFPRRNRIIAGLALGVVVIEAAQRSGSLITARLGMEAGREIFAAPGSPLDTRCRGSNDLIRQGAHLTESLADVLDNLPDHPAREGLARSPLFAQQGAVPGFADAPGHWVEPAEGAAEVARARTAIAGLLGPAPTSVDDLIRRCQFSAAAVMAVLLELELAGRIEALPGNRVALLAGPDPYASR
jgi:DNA processing protein